MRFSPRRKIPVGAEIHSEISSRFITLITEQTALKTDNKSRVYNKM